MRRTLLSALALLTSALTASAQQPVPSDYYEKTARPALLKYCGACHDPEDEHTEVNFLTALSVKEMTRHRALWTSVGAQLRNRTMPPADEDQPSEEERLRLASWIERTLRSTACDEGEYAGTVTTRRLNRTEYDNTMRDLFGFDLNLSESFPADGGGGEGFDNNGETLFLPPILMERYLEAAQTALDRAIVTPPLDITLSAAELHPQAANDRNAKRTLKPKESLTAMVPVYVEGEFDVVLQTRPIGDEKTRLRLKVDGIAADAFDVTDKPIRTTVRLNRGLHALAVTVPKGETGVEIQRFELREQRKWSKGETETRQRAHARIFTSKPGANADQQRTAAREILSAFMRRAFRRPVESAEVDKYLSLYDRAASRNDPFEESVKLALKGVLVSPHFLFRIEQPAESETPQAISDVELASRLSYFLWSSMPDEELLSLAEQGKLQRDDVLNAQVDRMLADEKASALSEHFTGQWLGTREVGARKIPDVNKFKGIYSTPLAIDMRTEAALLFEHILQKNRSLLDLIDCNYAIVNDRLAKHYGIEGVKGRNFRRVELKDRRRGGILGLGAVHILTSYPQRTSPVLRGAWVLETLLGTPVPSPPPDVPALKEKGREVKNLSLREKLQRHRDDPTCAACHNLMDPIGFGMENFDVVGRWRDSENKKPIDNTGTLPSGEKFTGPTELKRVLLSRKRDLARTLTERMLGYALGRSLSERDDCTIETIADRLAENEFKAQTLIRQVVLSTPFRYRQTEPEAE